jgi:hypothetical protein
VAAAFAAAAAPAPAAFTVSPTVIDVHTAPGRVASGVFEVSLRRERGRFTVEPEGLGQDVHGGFTFRPAGRSRFSAAAWLLAIPSAFAGAPARTQAVEFRVRVPRDAEPGDHVASLTVKRTPVARPGRAAIVQAVAVRLTIRVAGRVQRRAALADLRAPRVAGGGQVDAAVTVRNTGNQRLDFDHGQRGQLTITANGRRKASAAFAGVLYPGERREFHTSWSDPPLLGRVKVQAHLPSARPATLARMIVLVRWRQSLALALIAVAAILLVSGRRRRLRR